MSKLAHSLVIVFSLYLQALSIAQPGKATSMRRLVNGNETSGASDIGYDVIEELCNCSLGSPVKEILKRDVMCQETNCQVVENTVYTSVESSQSRTSCGTECQCLISGIDDCVFADRVSRSL